MAISLSAFQTAASKPHTISLRADHLILRERTKTDDHELPVEALQAAVAKARELGWIV
jgi:hypothetical protein